MFKRNIIAPILILLFVASLFGCANSATTNASASASPPTQSAATQASSAAEATASETSEEAGSEYEYYEFDFYFDNDTQTILSWGSDAVSKYLKDKFNIQVNLSRADTDPETKLNLMLQSGDLPDLFYMDNYTRIRRVAEMGYLLPLDSLIAANPSYNEYVSEITRKMQVMPDGNNYLIPLWTRTIPTGGNNVWMVDKRIYEAAGSPPLKTLEDIHAFMLKAKNDVKVNEEGLEIIPYEVDWSSVSTVVNMVTPVYRAYGGYGLPGNWYSRVDGKMQLALRDEKYRQSILELNRWYNEGLIQEGTFSDNHDQAVEKFVSGRVGVLWYDHSQDDVNKFRTILQEDFEGDDYLILQDPVFPPVAGLAQNEIFADYKEAFGWYGEYITTQAEQPQRIFDLLMFMLSKEGSINMMYGPPGAGMYDELDENGNPILLKSESELTSDERAAIGVWSWSMVAHADNVDLTKFAVDAALPKDRQSWVVSTQREILTPIFFMTNEYVQTGDVIEPTSDIGINMKRCEDELAAKLPLAVMAATPEECNRIYDEAIAFCDANGMKEAEALRDAKYQANLQLQGGTAFEPAKNPVDNPVLNY
ncbi:MAG: extracellular solute-binding protein [Clostridiales bacterium]|jgi:ABC-type glycerol-3-phosphate transport system substrate-binding protein|nr:extracellular solute-binding protein [Clostridiales bacterium]